MGQTGFLVPWLGDLGAWIRDIGSGLGLLTGIISLSKAFFDGRPSCYVEPHEVAGILKLFVENRSKRSIVIRGSHTRPRNRWYIARNAPSVNGPGRRRKWYGSSKSAFAFWNSLDVTIAPGQKHEFFLGAVNSDITSGRCFALITWRPSSILTFPRLPLPLYRSRSEMERLFESRRGDRDRSV